MKESIQYLSGKLKTLFNSHPYLEIRYEYKSSINTHVIEVKPLHCFNGDRPYILNQIEIESQFEENFYGEEIVFVSEGSLISLDDPILNLGVTSINVNATQFVTQKVRAVAPRISFGHNYCIFEQDNLFEVVNDPPETYIKTQRNNQQQPKDSLKESFLFKLWKQ